MGFSGDRRLLSLFVGLAVVLAAGAASAQFAGMFRDTALGPRDAEAAQTAGNRLFDGRTPRTGDTVRWRNETSGASGMARIAAITDGGTCAVVEHTLLAGVGADAEILRFRRCQDAAGIWQPGVAN